MNRTQFKRCIVILADGARPDVLDSELQKGNLPNISRYLIEGGTHETAITTFPSTTGPAYLPYLTGSYAGTCNIPGIRWFDREHYAKHGWSLKSFRSYVGLETYFMNRDMRREIKTVFEIFERPVNFLSPINRGIKRSLNKTKYSRLWYLYYGHITDRWGFIDSRISTRLIRALDDNPDFIFAVFPAIDEISHRTSPFHKLTLEAYRNLDRHCGDLINKLKLKGELEQSLLILVSDHGLSETKQHFDVGPFLEKKGLKTLYYTQIFKCNIKASSMVSGNGMAHLYIKSEKGWSERTTFEELSQKSLLLDELRLQPEVNLVSALGGDGGIHVLTKKGHGVFKIHGDQIDYKWNSEQEPLGVLNEKNINEKTMSMDESLNLSFSSHYPDIFVQLTQLFKAPRSGDIILSATPGCDLRAKYEVPEHRASHGSLCPEHMKIPLIMNCPVDKTKLGTRKYIRSVDVFSTLLQLMGKEVPQGIDGLSLVS